MVKDFYEYIKELLPERGSIFFTKENHNGYNAISLYQLADMICGKKCNYAKEVTGYSWKVEKLFNYGTEMIGLMFLYEDDIERWIHFSYNAFIGAICIVASRNGISFDDEFEPLRQSWQRKLENKESEEDKKYTDLNEPNFSEEWYYASHCSDSTKKHLEKLGKIRNNYY